MTKPINVGDTFTFYGGILNCDGHQVIVIKQGSSPKFCTIKFLTGKAVGRDKFVHRNVLVKE